MRPERLSKKVAILPIQVCSERRKTNVLDEPVDYRCGRCTRDHGPSEAFAIVHGLSTYLGQTAPPPL
jgi:hypothetical protein